MDSVKVVWVVGAAIVREERCLAARRKPSLKLGGRWEFPGGKVEPGETGPQALVREIQEELGVNISVGPLVGRNRHDKDCGEQGILRIELDVYWATMIGGELSSTDHDQLHWCTAAELAQRPWTDADIPLVSLVAATMGR